MPNKKKLYEALKAEGYDNFADESAFNSYVDNPDNRKKLFNALKSEGYDNFADEKSFDAYLGYSVPQSNNSGEQESVIDVPSDEMTDDDTQGSYQYDPKVQKHILENKPDMFKPKTVDMYGAHEKDKSEFDLMNEGKLYQMKAMRAASTIGEQLNERIKANEEALNEARKKQAEGNLQPSSNNRGRYSSVGLGGTIKERQEAYEKSYGKSPSRVEQTNIDDDVANLLAEQEYLKESKKVLDAAKNDAGFFQGMKDAIDASYLSFGLTDKLSAERIDTVQKKLSSGEALSDSEQSLLTSLGLQQMVNEQYNDLLGRWYKAGMVTAEMAPFMAEMAVNPLSGLGKSAMNMAVRKFGEKGAKAIAAKVLSRTIGDVAGAAGMAATTSMAGVTADAMARQRGYVKTDLDEKQGTIKGVGFEGGEDASDAWRKAFTSRTIENWSEMVGEYFSPIGKAVGKGFTKAFNKMGLSKVNDFIDNINSSEWVKLLDDFSERTQWNGPLGEFAEEQVGMIANAALVGDTKWSDITDLDQQLDVALGVGVFGTVMSLLRIGGYRTPKYRARKSVEGADKEGAKLYGEELWANVKETIGLSSDEELGKNLAELIAATGANQEQAEAAFKYANALKAQQAVNTVKEKAKIDMPGDMEVEAEAAYDEGSELQTPWEKHEAKRAVDRAEAALGVGSENSDEQLFAQMVMNGADSPVETVNAMAERGYTEEQIQKAKDYYTAVHRMNGLTDALLDSVNSQIESAYAEVDANTNKDNGSVTKVMLRDGSWGYVVEGAVVHGEKGIVDVNNSDDTVMVRLENGEVKMMNPNKDLYAVAWIDSPEQVKKDINVVLREHLINKAIGEIDWNPATPNPKVGDSFEMGGVPVTIVSHDGNGGMFVVPTEEYQSAVGSEQKMQQLVAKAQQQQPIPASEYKNWVSAQLDAQEDAQAMAQQEAETVTNSNELQPVAEGVASGEELSPVEEKRPMTEDEAASFIFQMERNAVEAPEIELTPENWIAEFGEDGLVETPIGQVKFGQSQYLKLQQQGRNGKLGMIRPTLINPDIIIEDASKAKEGDTAERGTSYVFVKAFRGKDGKRVYYFTSITIKKDGLEVVVSNQEKRLKQIQDLMMRGKMLWNRFESDSDSSGENQAFSSATTENPNSGQPGSTAQSVVQSVSDAQIEESVPLNDSNKPTSTDNQSAWLGINSSELSTNKDSDNNVQSQENKDKPLHEREKEDVFRELGEKYGEKMPHKVEVTAKALADDLAKAQKKLDKAIEEYDNAPIGREEKAEKARDKAQEEFDAIKREAEFWTALDKEIKDAQTSPGDEVAEEILSMEEPLNGEEFAAQMLANGNIKLLQDSFASETGFGKEEAKKYFGLFASSDKGGMTIQQAGERLMEADRENGTNFFDQNDPNAGRNAIIQVLGMAKTKKDLANILPNNRTEQARKEKEAEFRAYESWVDENFHMSVADFEAYESSYLPELAMSMVSEEEINDFISTFVDETINNNQDEQGIITESEGGSEVLSGTQPLQTERIEGTEEESGQADGRIPEKNGAVPEGASGSEVEGSGAVEEAQEVLDNIKKARKEVDTNPTEAQKEAGNYKKGHIKIDGFDITIENPKGGVRSGTDKNGKKWSITMNNDYGYIRGTEAVDGDHIDVFLSSFPTQGSVFVVDQSNEDGSFDESKVMYGFSSLEEARAAYLSNYEKGWESRIMAITEVSKEEFKKWVDSSHRKTKAFSEYKSVKVEEQKPYTIEPAQYTTKKGKVLDMHLVKFNVELRKGVTKNAYSVAKSLKGWWDKDKGGFMMRSEADAKQLAEYVADAQSQEPVSMETMKDVSDGNISFSEPQGTPVNEGPVWQYVVSVDKGTGLTTLRREDVSGVIPVGDARFTIQATSPQEMLDILRNPLNGLQQALEAVEVTLENRVKTMKMDAAIKNQPLPIKEEPTNPSGNKLVSDERYAELRERMKQKLRGQMNMGIDPEILAIGTEMAVYHIEKGARKFAEYAKAMIADLGDAIRPYLKAFYNGARDLPEMQSEGLTSEMTPYDEVSSFDVANFDKASSDVVAVVEMIAKEQEVEVKSEVAKVRVKKEGKPKKKTKESVSLLGDLFNQNVEENESNDDGRGNRQKASGTLPTDGGRKHVASTTGNQTTDESLGSRPRKEDSQSDRGGLDTGMYGRDVSDENGSDRIHGSSIEQSVKKNVRNFSFGEGHIEVPSGDVAKLKANIAAIRTLKEIEASGQPATDAQKAVLAKYVGWGGLSAALDEQKFLNSKGWMADRNWNEKYLPYYKELRELLTKEEFNDAVQSTLTSHYTPEEIIRGMWNVVERMGFKGGRINEPAAGIGHILGLMPSSISERSIISGTELDSLSGRIAKALYPDANIKVQGYEKEFAPKSKDLVITNVPFGKTAPYDKALDKALHKKMGSAYNLHNYFIAKGLLELKEGGIGVFVTSSATMDGANSKFREWVAANGIDLIGAIRLPNNAFLKNAGTSVTADMLVFRKRKSGEPSNGVDFVSTTQVGEGNYVENGKTHTKPIMINEYFAEHPEMMLGEMMTAHDAGSGGLYSGASQTCVAEKGADLGKELQNAIMRLDAMDGNLSESQNSVAIEGQAETTDLKNGTLVVKGDDVLIAINGELQPIATKKEFTFNGKKQKTAHAVRDYIALKETLKSLIAAEQSSTENPEPIRKKLNKEYDAFVAKYGTLNRNKALDDVLAEDFEHNLPLSLENVKRVPSATGKSMVWEVTKGEGILSKRVSFPVEEPTKAENLDDAIHISRSYRGVIDVPYVAALLGQTEEEVTNDMLQEGLAYRNPITGNLEDKESYLSGNVKEKLEQARAMAEEHPEYQKNVEDLAEVQPETVRFGDISYRIGTPWIPTEYVNDFASEVLGVRSVDVQYIPELNEFVVSKSARVDDFAKSGQFRTDRVGVIDLLEYALNQRKPKIFDKHVSYGPLGKVEERVPNEAETQAAAEKIMEISDKFIEYIDGRSNIHRELERIYNDKYNNYRLKTYELPSFSKMEKDKDGKEVLATHYPNSNVAISLREHQAKAVQRCLSESTLLAHQVGTGKTFTMITAAMEMRRLGIAKKPMIVVQNATLEDFVKDFYKLYPGANVLAPGKDERSAENRKRLFNLIATGDFDAIVIPQSFMQFIPDDEGRKKELIQKRIEEYERALEKIEDYSLQKRMQKEIDSLRDTLEGKEKKRSVKDSAKVKESIKAKVEKTLDRRTDEVLTFEQMGIGALFIDEAHNYKKIGFASKMSNVKGIDTSASQRANSLLLKAQYVQEKNGGRNVVLATGTPITNTMAEVWTMMKFVSPEILETYNIQGFDDFATTFGTVEPSLEFTATGNFKIADRFKSYVNVPELVKAFRSHADVVLTSDVKEFKKSNNIPKLKDDQMTNVVIEKNEDLEDVMDILIKKLEAYNEMSGSEKREWSALPLVVFSRAKQAAIDLRLLNPSYEDNPNSKTNHVVRNVLKLYQESTPEKGAQMIFCDSYQSPGEAPKMDLFDYDPDVPRFNLYEDIKKKLVEGGIPANEIAIVNNYDGERRKQLFEKVRNGDVRVLLGSTEKMGVGVNVQDRMFALHHIDAPIRPMDFEQRNGRILRQGNLYATWGKPVNVVTYGVQGTLDATAYDRLRVKQDFINQMMKGDVSGRIMEEQDEEDPSGMTFNQMAATLSGDKTAQLLFVAENDLKKLRNLKRSDFNSKSGMGMTIQSEERRLVGLNDKLELWGKAKEITSKYFPEGVTQVKVNGETFTEKFGPSLDPVIENYEEAYSLNRGTAPLKISLNNGNGEVIVHFDEGKMVYELYAGKEHVVESRQFNGGKGLMSSIEHQLKATEKNYNETKQKIAETKSKIQGLEKAMNAPWGREEDLKKKEQEVADLKKKLEEKALENSKNRPVEQPKNEVTVDSDEEVLYRTVYHGSGASFDKFDHSFMGSGEGAQAYGWGTYVTEVGGIARTYATTMASKSGVDPLSYVGEYENYVGKDAINIAKEYMRRNSFDLKKAKEQVEHDLKLNMPALSRKGAEFLLGTTEEDWAYNPNRHLYEVEIPDDNGNNYLYWDKQYTRTELEDIASRSKGAVSVDELDPKGVTKDGSTIKGGKIVRAMSEARGPHMAKAKEASEKLSLCGLVGIEYPAEFRTGGREDNAKNYVIFNEKDLDIKRHTKFRRGEGALTADEVSMANDPIGKVLGYSSRTASERKTFAERERVRMVQRVNSLAKKLGLKNVEIVLEGNTLKGKKAKAKGFYSRINRKITIVISNHTSVFDVEQTLLHEAVAHYGLRELFGPQFDVFLDNVYRHAASDVRERINRLAEKNGWDFRTATEEYLASLAEDTNFENMDESWWGKIKEFFLDMLHQIGFTEFSGVTLTDNELRYILWRSYENLAEPGSRRSIFGEAADIVMQDKLKVGNYSYSKYERERDRLLATGRTNSRVAEGDAYTYTPEDVIQEFEEVVANHPDIYAIRTEEDIDALPTDRYTKRDIKAKFNNPRVTGTHIEGGMMILFVDRMDEAELRATIPHELAHYASRNLKFEESYKMSALSYLQKHFPNSYKKVQEYPREKWGEEAVSHLFEEKVKELGFEKILNGKFDTHNDIGYIFYNITNYLNHGRRNNPLRYGERPSSQRANDGKGNGLLQEAGVFGNAGLRNRKETEGSLLSNDGRRADSELGAVSGSSMGDRTSSRASEKQAVIDQEYLEAARSGDFDKAISLFREYVLSKAEEDGVVPIDYAVGYRGHSHSSIAKKVKEENPDAISEAAYQMSKRVPKGSILIPMPSRSGKATYTIKLAEAIAKATDSEVRDVLRGEERMSVYEAKKKGLKINSRDLGLYVTEKLPKDKNVIIIDNVIDRGITALAAVEAVDGGSVLAYAFTKGSKDRVVPLKLSDPITYDDNLRIIPLSERFNANTDDLRYREAEDEELLYRIDDEVEGMADNTARKLYEDSVKGKGYRFQEGFQDSMLALKKLQEAIVKQHGGKLEEWEDAYTAENQMSSRDTAEIENFVFNHFKPMMKEVANVLKRGGMTYEELRTYLFAKSGLERNRDFAVRDAISQREKDGDDVSGIYEAYMQRKQELLQDLKDGTISFREYCEEMDNEAMMIAPDLMGKDYSGLSSLFSEDNFTEDAIAEVEAVEDFVDTSDLWNVIKGATQFTLDRAKQSGVMNTDVHKKLSEMFEWYIPMRGWSETKARDVYEYFGSQEGVFNPSVKNASGRKSLADDPLATISNMAESAIFQGNKNQMKQKLLNLTFDKPTNLITVMDSWIENKGTDTDPRWEYVYPPIEEDDDADVIAAKIKLFEEEMEQKKDEGRAKKLRGKADVPYIATPKEIAQHIIRVKRNGREFVMILNGNPRAAQAVNGMTNPETYNGIIEQVSRKLNRFMAAAFTTKNPTFIMRNLSRDLIFSNTAVAVKENTAYGNKFRRYQLKVLGNMRGLMKRYQSGKLDMGNELDKMFMEFIKNGGETGFAQLTSVDEYKKKIQRELNITKNGGAINKGKKVGRAVMETIEFYNRCAEDVSRFTVFMTSRQMGRSIQRSVSDAKEITVNFNKRGSGSKAGGFIGFGAQSMRSLYLFFNAAVQALVNFKRLGQKHPVSFTSALSMYAVSGFLMPVVNEFLSSILGGDDDDYENLPEWVRRNNLVISLGKWGGDAMFFTVPLPIEMRAFYGLGETANQMMAGNVRGKDAALQIAGQFAEMLPLNFVTDAAGPWNAFTPDAFKPIVQAYITNKDWTGKPIYRDNGFNKELPEWTKAYAGTSKWLVNSAELMNEFTGGDKYKSGVVDANPARLEHLFTGYLGGFGDMFLGAYKTVSMLWDEDYRNIRHTPVLKAFLNQSDERTSYAQVKKDYASYKDEYEDTVRRLNGYEKELNRPETAMEYAERMDFLYRSPQMKRYEIMREYERELSKMYKMMQEYPDSEVQKSIMVSINQLKANAVEMLRSIE